MGMLRLTNAQWNAVQSFTDRPRVTRVFNRVNLGDPAPFDASGNPTDPASAAAWVFDDHRLPGYWRVRVAAGPSVFLQEWDAPLGGTMVRELTLREAIEAFGGVF